MNDADAVMSDRLAANIRALRDARGLSQQHVAKLAGIPRATWAHLESGGGNPTLTVLRRAADALQVTLEELLSPPRASVQRYDRAALPKRVRGGVTVHSLLPDALPGLTLERLELPPHATMVGVPHTPGTREYLTCEEGSVRLTASGQQFDLESGDVVVFRGDQRHGYSNPSSRRAVAYSVVVISRT